MKRFFYLTGILLFSFNVNAQHKNCGTVDRWNKLKEQDPEAVIRRQNLELKTQEWIRENGSDQGESYQERVGVGVVTIPVVVHIVYNTTEENISDAQVLSQMEVLNEDFRLLNSDSLTPSHPFWDVTADVEIEFCLASQDPNGNPTTGITRTQTNVSEFSDDAVKFDADGGKDGWDPTKYLNVWVCNLQDQGSLLFGYAAWPSDLAVDPELDGVVIQHRAFGTVGTAGTGDYTYTDRGRTLTHEVGHWLNLWHIWGDDICGDDLVADTEPAESENETCPSFPHRPNNSCGSGSDGEMYMNFMDYVPDDCMVMFTAGQKDRMWAALTNERSAIMTSTGCEPASSGNNDECSGATNLQMNTTCTTTQGNVDGATQSLPDCTGGGSADDDVWFSFTASVSQAYIDVTGSSDFDAVVEAFEGSCGSLTSLSCTDNSVEGQIEEVTLTGLTPGNKYYIRVYEYYAGMPSTTTFDICVWHPTVGVYELFASEVSIYPNPTTTGQVRLEVSDNVQGLEVRVFNSVGSLVNYQDAVGTNNMDVRLGKSSGIYFVQLVDDLNRMATFKVVKE